MNFSIKFTVGNHKGEKSVEGQQGMSVAKTWRYSILFTWDEFTKNVIEWNGKGDNFKGLGEIGVNVMRNWETSGKNSTAGKRIPHLVHKIGTNKW